MQYVRSKNFFGNGEVVADVGKTHRLISANTTNATLVKAGAGAVFLIYAVNLNAAIRYMKVYDIAQSPNVGVTQPTLTLPIPASATGAGFILSPACGFGFSAGLAYALVTGIADSDATAVAASEIIVNLVYV